MADDGTVTDMDRLRSAIKNNDFIRFLFPDIIGQLRGKVFPCSTVNLNGEGITVSALTSSVRGVVVCLPDQEAIGFRNVLMRPDPSTLVERTWSVAKHGAKICQVLCDLVHEDGSRMEEDLRWIAQRQVDRLAELGLELFAATEFEFRMYKQEAGEWVPATADPRMFLPEYLDIYEPFMVDLQRRTDRAGIRMYTLHPEAGPGQVEIPLLPSWGLRVADDAAVFRALVRETALDHGFRASFMTKDQPGPVGPNGAHFNHSLWRREAGSRLNAFTDRAAPHRLSQLGRHWLAGLLCHARALTALCYPTVNCYRRFADTWTPSRVDWAAEDRLVAFRVKWGVDGTFVENRLPSAAANAHLVLAATVAAGLDGVEKEMELREEKSGEERLPSSLGEALAALKEDAVVCEAVGRRFVDWLVALKEEEMGAMSDGGLEEERKAFLFTA